MQRFGSLTNLIHSGQNKRNKPGLVPIICSEFIYNSLTLNCVWKSLTYSGYDLRAFYINDKSVWGWYKEGLMTFYMYTKV